jgi:hypothetical protein
LAKHEKREERAAPAEPIAPAPTAQLRVDPPHVSDEPPADENGSPASATPTPEESVLAQWQRALTDGPQQSGNTHAPRASRRERLAAIAEQPFVRRAMELFDVAPGQFRYTPPDGDAD